MCFHISARYWRAVWERFYCTYFGKILIVILLIVIKTIDIYVLKIYCPLYSFRFTQNICCLRYFLWVTVAVLHVTENPFIWLLALIGHRFLRTLNQTGDQWAHLPDTSDWLSQPHNRPILSAFCLLSVYLFYIVIITSNNIKEQFLYNNCSVLGGYLVI